MIWNQQKLNFLKFIWNFEKEEGEESLDPVFKDPLFVLLYSLSTRLTPTKQNDIIMSNMNKVFETELIMIKELPFVISFFIGRVRAIYLRPQKVNSLSKIHNFAVSSYRPMV